MSLVNVHNEWDPLEEVIVGRATNARIARPDIGLFAVEYREYERVENIPPALGISLRRKQNKQDGDGGTGTGFDRRDFVGSRASQAVIYVFTTT